MRFGKLFGIAGLIGFAAVGTVLAGEVTFDAGGSFADGSVLGGSIVIDTATGLVQSNGVDLTVTAGTSDNFTFDELSGAYNIAFDSSDNFYEINFLDSSYSSPAQQPQNLELIDPILTLTIPIGSNTNLIGFTGSPSLCSSSLANCGGGNYYSSWQQYYLSDAPAGDPLLSSGSLTSGPEPASLLLLAAPLAFLIRRQLRKV